MSRPHLPAALGPALLAAGGTAVALLVEHLALWGDGERGWLWKRYGRLGAYTLGVATLNSGFTAWALRTGNARAAGVLWLIAAAGGAVIGGAWLWRAPSLALKSVYTWGRAYLSMLDLATLQSDPGTFGRSRYESEIQ